MDTKVETKEEFILPDYCPHHLTNAVKNETVTSNSDCEIHTKSEIEKKTVVRSQNQKEFFLEESVSGYNKGTTDSKTQTKIEIKEEQLWLETTTTENLCIYDDIQDGTDGNISSMGAPSLYKQCVSSYTSGLFSNEDLGNDIGLNMLKDGPEYERVGKCQSQDSNVTDISSIKTRVVSEKPNSGKIDSSISCLTQNNLLQQSNTRKQDVNKENCTYKTILHSDNLSHECRKAYKCDICKKCFIDLSDLKRHKMIHDCKTAHICDICDKIFSRLPYLKVHKLVHEGKKPHKCDICGKAFTHLLSWKMHKLIHEGKKPHKCNICDKAFTQLSHLKTHEVIHGGKKPHMCDICDKAFTQLSSLKRHRLIHEDKKAYKCNICDKAFTQLSSLKRHRLIHEDKKAYKCNICDKTFTRLANLERHKLTHEDRKSHNCNICDKYFTHFSSLKRHKLFHEGIKDTQV